MLYEKVLVTGANGLLGRYMVDDLLAHGHAVAGFDRAAGEAAITWREGDVCDAEAVKKAVAGQDAIVHLAALAHIWAGSGEQIMKVNTLGTWQVLNAAEEAGVKRVVVCSTDSVVGFTVRQGMMIPPDYLPVDESHVSRATDPYALSKVLVEEIARSFVLRGKLEVIVMRPVFVLYPHMDVEVRKRAYDPENYKAPDRPGAAGAGGGAVWHHVDPRDAARAFRLAVEKPGLKYDTFFLTANCTIAPEPTLERMKNFLGGTLPEIRKPEVYAQNPHAPLYDLTHIREVLGFEPEYDCRHMLEDYYRHHAQTVAAMG